MNMYNIAIADGGEEKRGAFFAGHLLGFEREQLGRFRDAWVETDVEGHLRIAVYTRNGGGNRPDYERETQHMQAHPLYIFDQDDDFDSTYATYYFKFPMERPAHLDGTELAEIPWEEIIEVVQETAHPEPVIMSEVWAQSIKRMEEHGPTEAQLAAFAPLAEKIKEVIDEAGGVDVEIDIVAVGRDPKKVVEELGDEEKP